MYVAHLFSLAAGVKRIKSGWDGGGLSFADHGSCRKKAKQVGSEENRCIAL